VKNKVKPFIITLLLITISSSIYSQNNKVLKIRGTNIFEESELFDLLNLKRFQNGRMSLAEVTTSIEKFYKDNYYILVRVYSIEVQGKNEYMLFVDEGKLGKVVVHNLNHYYSLKFKQQIDIPERVYNTDVVEKNLEYLRTKYPDREITAELKEVPDYDDNLIQLDREFQKLRLGDIIDLDFLRGYSALYDLHFYVNKRSRKKESDIAADTGKDAGVLPGKTEGFGFEIETNFPIILVPTLYYYGENMLAKKDYLETTLRASYDFGFDGLFNWLPENTLVFPPERKFAEFIGEYKVSPMQSDLIGPLMRERIYLSDSSRPDLEISSYSYLSIRTTVAPEITLLKNMNVYAGIGAEQVKIYDAFVNSPEAEDYIQDENFYMNPFAELRLKFDPVPLRIGNRIDKYILFTFSNYFKDKDFAEFEMEGIYDAEFENLSILSLKFRIFILSDNPPFYHSKNVNNKFFKGFTGENYMTNKQLSLGSEYRFSIYQDYLYAGAFFEWTIFEPEGNDLSGTRQGTVWGPTGRVLVYDQYEFTVYYGFEKLLPDDKTGTMLKMKFSKKW
jgi:hypothetical protein